ncbi:ABC transporter permease [Oceanobacillus bengalensis]|uniref:ABC transporter permease n=1 Tax=Oceanobacillus bengalensis TaxID=1435466 RepID=A0A494Z258_9BACI|nr:ABC transporter permease [Oceanobacillus bengalensis]RKQ16565.1 ABC transporter permease [Oceanobacillus bengalensis]
MSAEVVLGKKAVAEKKDGFFIQTFKKLLKNKLAVFGLVIISLQIILAIFAPFLVSYGPNEQNLALTNQGVGTEGHILGTDNYGRDMWSRIVYGARISLVVGISTVAIGLVGGITLGLLAGYFKKLDNIIMRFMDLLFAFPGILLAMLIIATLGTSLVNVVIAISIWSIPGFARIVRGSVLSIKKQEYILAMRSIGASNTRILLKHILPNCTAPIIVNATMRMGTAILSTASLSFLGLGAQPPTPEWGAMIAAGQDFMWDAPHIAIIPGVAIMLTIFAFNVVGDGLRDALDPNMDIQA